jgi:transcription antitermination factor NusG
MDTGPTRNVPDLEAGQKVIIKTGTFAGMQGLVTKFQRGGNEPEATTEVRVDVRVHGRIAPVLFTNPTMGELELIE